MRTRMRRHRQPRPSRLDADHDDSPTPLRLGLAEAAQRTLAVLDGWLATDVEAVPLRRALDGLRRDACLAIVLLENSEHVSDSVKAACRAAAVTAALRINACLASAYQERAAPPRTILTACHAIARLIEQLHGAIGTDAVPRWN